MTEAKFYTQKTAEINGRHVWLHLVACPIGNIFITQYEDLCMEVHSIYGESLEKAEKAFRLAVTRMLDGKL